MSTHVCTIAAEAPVDASLQKVAITTAAATCLTPYEITYTAFYAFGL
jgi:hypothetical protein